MGNLHPGLPRARPAPVFAVEFISDPAALRQTRSQPALNHLSYYKRRTSGSNSTRAGCKILSNSTQAGCKIPTTRSRAPLFPPRRTCLIRGGFPMAEAGNLDDRSLVEEFKRSGDQACIAALFQRYARRLYALAHGIEHDHANAEDCVQETFRREIQEIGRFDEAREGSNVWAWLVTIAEHVCFDELRR